MRILLIGIFVLMVAAQWLVPAKMIYDHEVILTSGTPYKFRTAPVDPADPFRGKYITLNFAETSIGIVDPTEWEGAEYVYVSVENDSAGFAHISAVSMYEPENADYIKADVSYVSTYEPYTLQFRYPFDRLYLEESKAAEAERQYWSSRTDSTQVTYAIVYVKQGEAALKDVMINDRSIVDIVSEINAGKP